MKSMDNVCKRFTTLLVMAALVATFAIGADAAPTGEDTEALATLKQAEREAVEAARWDAFSANLVKALQAENEGVKLAALQLVIRYGDQVNVNRAVFDVMRVYRDHADDDVRRMAVVALGKMQHRRAINFLDRSEDFEKDKAVRKTIRDVVAAYHAAT